MCRRPSPWPVAVLPPARVLLSAGRVAYGCGLLLAPARALTACGGSVPSKLDCQVARVLGARHVIQAALSARGGRQALAVGAVTDGLHATSMLILAAADARLRRAALADAVIESLLAALGAALC